MISNAKSRHGPDAECAELLAAQGAIMTLGCSPVQHFLVGDFAWVGPHHVYWFAANGDSSADAHLLEFEEAHCEGNGVHFFVGGRKVAAIAAIDATEVGDPDDFRIAWQIWQQVAPMRSTLLACSREAGAAQVVRGTDATSKVESTTWSEKKRRAGGGELARYSVAAHRPFGTEAWFEPSPV